MKNRFLLLLLFLSFQFSNAQLSENTDWNKIVGKNFSSLKESKTLTYNTFPYKFSYDDSVSVFYVFGTGSGHLYHVFCFSDKIFRVNRIIDGSLFGDPCVLDTVFKDQRLEESFEKYFKRKYRTSPDYNSAEKSRYALREDFAIVCGGGAEPRGKGILYREKETANLSSEEISRYLLSFSPQESMVGMLLFKRDSHKEIEDIFLQMSNREMSFRYCNSCSGSSVRTLKEILKENRLDFK